MMAKLGEVCEVNPKIEKYEDDFKVSFVPMPKVSETGEIDTSEVRNYSEVKKGFTGFKDGDVLFAKITPCMENGKGAVAHSLMNSVGFGSTEFHVLRPKADLTTSKWLFYLTSWHEFRVLAEKHMTGSAGQKRVPKKFLEDYEINLPSIEEQRRVAGVLDKVTALMDARRTQLTHLDTLIKARFVEMFGNLGENEFGWGLEKLESFCEINPKKNSDARLTDDLEVSFVPMQAVSDNGEMNATEIKLCGEVKKGFTYFAEDDVLFAKITPCMENGKGAVAKNLHNSIGFGSTEFHVLRPQSDVCNAVWLYTITSFEYFRKEAEVKMTGSAGQKRVPATFLKNYKVALPPLALQNDFADFVTKVDAVKASVQASLNELDTLKKSLMQTYFG